MEFTFTDYTFSGLLAILAALYGVGYPLIIQSIGRIHAQYNSVPLSERFTREPVYLVFQGLLILNVAFAIVTPFLLHAGWNNLLFITLQAVFLVLLVGQTFLLFNLILKYSNGAKLLKHIEGRKVDKNNIFQIFDLAVYADSQHLFQLYLECMSDIHGYILAQQGDQLGVQRGKQVLPPPMYDDITTELVRRMCGFIRENDGHPYLYRQNDIVAAFFNQVSDSRVSPQALKYMWWMTNEAISYGNHDWFSQYWQFADSYANIKYHFLSYSEKELQRDKARFEEQHVMVGAALMHFKRYAWLNDIFFYTHSEPEYYGLIPSHFSQIIFSLRRLERLVDNPMAGGWPYYFADSMTGATDEKHIFREAVRYYTLLVIRLWSMKGRNLMDHTNIMDYPVPSVVITDEEQEIRLVKMMLADVEEWYAKDVFELMPSLTKVDKQEVIAFLENYITNCEADVIHKKDEPVVSHKKFEALEQEIITAAKSTTFSFPMKDKDIKWPQQTIYEKDVIHQAKIETLHFSDYMNIGVSSLGEMHWTNFVFEVNRSYLWIIARLNCLKKVNVTEDQLKAVFEQIKMTDEYAVVTSEEIQECPRTDICLMGPQHPKWIVIIPKDELPVVELKPYVQEGLYPLYEGALYSSNYVEFIGCREPAYGLAFATTMRGYTNSKCKGYVLLTIDCLSQPLQEPVNVGWTLNELFEK